MGEIEISEREEEKKFIVKDNGNSIVIPIKESIDFDPREAWMDIASKLNGNDFERNRFGQDFDTLKDFGEIRPGGTFAMSLETDPRTKIRSMRIQNRNSRGVKEFIDRMQDAVASSLTPPAPENPENI